MQVDRYKFSKVSFTVIIYRKDYRALKFENCAQAELREAQRKERTRQKSAAKKEQEKEQKLMQAKSRADDDDEREVVGEMDPNYIDWINEFSDEEGNAAAARVRDRSRSKVSALLFFLLSFPYIITVKLTFENFLLLTLFQVTGACREAPYSPL